MSTTAPPREKYVPLRRFGARSLSENYSLINHQLGNFRKYGEILISSKYAGFLENADFEITSSQL